MQRKLGNLPPELPAFKPPPFTAAEDEASLPKDKSWIDRKTEDELEDLEEDADLDDDRFLEEYRKKRLAELREAAKVARFGSVILISGSDFVRDVSQAPSDVWVVPILYKDNCIPNYPAHNLPTLLVYSNGVVKANYVGLQRFARRCTPEGLALVLCQSDPVLNDGQSGSDQSSKAVIDGVCKRFLEKVVTEHKDDDDGSSSD